MADKVQQYLSVHNYFIALRCATEFGLQGIVRESDVEFLVMPVALQNGNSYVLNFIGQNRRLATQVGGMLDRVVYLPFSQFTAVAKKYPDMEKQPNPRVAQGKKICWSKIKDKFFGKMG